MLIAFYLFCSTDFKFLIANLACAPPEQPTPLPSCISFYTPPDKLINALTDIVTYGYRWNTCHMPYDKVGKGSAVQGVRKGVSKRRDVSDMEQRIYR